MLIAHPAFLLLWMDCGYSDSSDELSQQLEIWNRFNPHAPSIFPTLVLPFFVTAPVPSSLLTPLNLGLKWV